MLEYRKRQKGNHLLAVIMTVLAVCLVFAISRWGRGVLTGPLVFFTRPLWQASDNLGTITSLQVSRLGQSRQGLLIENKKLQEENSRLKTLIFSKNNIEADNLKLRSILGKTQNLTKSIVARVIFLPNFVPYNNLLLDIGNENNLKPIKIGDSVIADGVVLIGRIAEIDSTYSKARLISAEGDLPVVIGSKNIPAVAVGSGAGNFTITLPKDTPIVVGDKVTAPLVNNYLIGSVGHIEKLPSRPTQTVLVRTPVNLYQLKWVEIYGSKI